MFHKLLLSESLAGNDRKYWYTHHVCTFANLRNTQCINLNKWKYMVDILGSEWANLII